MPEIELSVSGRIFGGWTAMTVTRSMESAVGTFTLSVSERWPSNPTQRPIRPGASAVVLLDGQTVITGFVDTVRIGLTGDSHTIQVRGRDAALDLVDSAPDLDPGEWSGLTVLEVAKALAEPFGIKVSADVDVGAPFQKVALNPGQRAWELIEELCRYRALLPVSDGLGGLRLTRAGLGRAVTPLVEGGNILRASADFSWTDRYSDYVVKGQTQGSDEFFGDAAAAPVGHARDAEIKRHRPFLVIASSGVDEQQARDRARWEASVRAGRGARATITVQGWTQEDGSLWPVNSRVAVRSPTLGLDREMLISGVTNSLDEEGTLTRLSVVRPDAFELLAEPEVADEELGF